MELGLGIEPSTVANGVAVGYMAASPTRLMDREGIEPSPSPAKTYHGGNTIKFRHSIWSRQHESNLLSTPPLGAVVTGLPAFPFNSTPKRNRCFARRAHRQAFVGFHPLGSTMNIIELGSGIGPDAVANCVTVGVYGDQPSPSMDRKRIELLTFPSKDKPSWDKTIVQVLGRSQVDHLIQFAFWI